MHLAKVLVKQNGSIERTALGLGMELGGEDGLLGVDHTLVGLVVEVDKVGLELGRQGVDVNGVSVVLGSDVALAGGQIQSGDVVSSVTVLELDGLGAGSQSQQLVAETDTEDGQLGELGLLVHNVSQVEHGLLAVSGVTGAVRDEDTIKVVGNVVDGVVVGEDGDGGTSRDKRSQNVLLDTTVDDGNVQGVLNVGSGRHVEGLLGGHSSHEVDLAGVDEGGVLLGVVLLANGDSAQGRALLSKVGDDGSGVDARDGSDSLSLAPLAKGLDGGPVRVLEGGVSDDDANALDVGGLKVLDETKGVGLLAGGYSVITDQRLGEDQNLTSVRGVGHGLGVADHTSGEDGLAGHDSVGSKRSAGEDGAVLQSEGGRGGRSRGSAGGGSGHESGLEGRGGSRGRSGHGGQSSNVLEHVVEVVVRWCVGVRDLERQ